MEKISKLQSIIKKDGIMCTIKKVLKYIWAKYIDKYNIKDFMNKKKLENKINEILNTEYDRVIIWRGEFGWNVPLFQRPQHIANNLAKQNCLVFYQVTKMTDKIDNIKKENDNLYLVNFNNIVIKNILEKRIAKINKPKYIQIYSTDCVMELEKLKEYINNNYKIIYEYIDDLSPEIVGRKEIPKNMLEKYNYMLENTKDIFVVVTAEQLKKDILKKRGSEKLIEASNGVDCTHFQNFDNNFIFDDEYKKILDMKKNIIGYYGAMAKWIDYDLLKYVAKNRPDYNIVLIGVKYDDSFEKANLKEYKNIFFIGSKDYNILPYYAEKFTVCMIPFLINDITRATSPVKLFEYMALGKPIITTHMDECLKYKCVFIANDKESFLNKLDICMNLKDKSYYELLKKEALNNTWEAKVKNIIMILMKEENSKEMKN